MCSSASACIRPSGPSSSHRGCGSRSSPMPNCGQTSARTTTIRHHTERDPATTGQIARLRSGGGVATGPVTAPPATPQCRRGLECRTGRERIQITPMSLEVLHSAAPAGLSRRPERIVRQSHRPAYAALGRTQVRIVCRSRRRERGVVASAWSAAGVVCEMVRDLLHQHARDIQAAGRVLFDAPSHRTRGRQIEPRRDEVVPEGPERPVGLDLRVRGEGEPLEGFAPGLEPPPRSV